MSNKKYTSDQLLLLLNYDTNARVIFSIPERCIIHKAIHRGEDINKEFSKKIKELLLNLKVQNYKPKFFVWVENIEKDGGYALQESKINTYWNFLK